MSRAGWRYTYYADPWLLSAVPNGGPNAGGTAVTLRGYGLLGGVVASALKPRCKFCHAADVDATGTRCARGVDAEGEPLDDGEYSTNLSSAPLLPQSSAGLTAVTALALEATAAGLEAVVCTAPAVANGTVTLELALNGVDGSPSSVAYRFYPQPAISALDLAAGPLEGGSAVTLRGTGFDAFGAVVLALAWSTAGGASATHRLESRCRFGTLEVPVLDMSPTRV
eukprot:6195220-Prymnesium_polylepis.1